MKRETVKMLHSFMEDKSKSPEGARLIVNAFKEEGLSTEDILSFIRTLTNEYEQKIFGVFTGKVLGLDEILINALANDIEWENLSSEEVSKIIFLSKHLRNGNYDDNILYKAIKADKLSVEKVMEMISRSELGCTNNHSLQLTITKNKLSIEQVEKVVKASGNYWPVVIRAIETKLFSINQMLGMWEKSYRDYGVALAIVKTGLSSDENKKTLAGSDAGFLKELMEYK